MVEFADRIAPPAEYLIYPDAKHSGDKSHPRALFIHYDQDRNIKNIVADYFDPETRLYYIDDSKKKLYIKQVGLCLQATITYGIKWAYHLSCIGIIMELGKSLCGDNQPKPLSERVVSEIKNMVRTPIYGIAIIAIALSSVFFSPFKNTYVYTARKYIAKLEFEYNYQTYEGGIYSAPCFRAHEIFNKELENKTVRDIYLDKARTIAGNFADFHHLKRDPCANGCSLLDDNEAYISPVLTTEQIAYARGLNINEDNVLEV